MLLVVVFVLVGLIGGWWLFGWLWLVVFCWLVVRFDWCWVYCIWLFGLCYGIVFV